MSSSYVRYRGYGFWSFDPYLEHLLVLLAKAVQKIPNQEWSTKARDHWLTQASGNFAGWIDPMFDEYIRDEEHRFVLISALDTLIPQRDLTIEVRKTAELLRSLIEGRMSTDESSPLDYMVRGPQPYNWRSSP